MDGPSSPNDPHKKIHSIHDLLKQYDKCKYYHTLRSMMLKPSCFCSSVYFLLSFYISAVTINLFLYVLLNQSVKEWKRENSDIFI